MPSSASKYGGPRNSRPHSAGAPEVAGKRQDLAKRYGSSPQVPPATLLPTKDGSALSRPVSAVRQRPASAAPLLKEALFLQACTVCRDEPLIFQECPACSARYCASGCLHSWYEHSKPSRSPPIQVSVLNSEDDYIKAELPDGEADLALFRAAGGVVIADEADSGNGKRRWGISSVDGWVLGTPGPGSDWRPAAGVSLTLEELGCCRACKNPVAVPEYICNSACRGAPRSLSAQRRVNGAPGVQKPRVRTAEAATQTDLEFAEAEVQAVAEAVDSEIQAVPPPGFAQLRAQATIAGYAIADLACTVDCDLPEQKLVLTAEPTTAAARIHTALMALATASVTLEGAQQMPADWNMKLRSAENAVRQLGPVDEVSIGQIEGDTSRVLGHRRRVALPTFTAEDGSSILQFQDDAPSALVTGALDALRRASTPSAPSAPPSDTKRGKWPDLPSSCSKRTDDIEAEQILFSHQLPSQEKDSSARSGVGEALSNIAALLCSPGYGESKIASQVTNALAAIVRLVPGSAEGRINSWRSLLAKEPEAKLRPNGWTQLKEVLDALFEITDGPPTSAEGLLLGAMKAVACLALFIDAEATAAEEAAARAAEQTLMGDVTPSLGDAPPPPPPPPNQSEGSPAEAPSDVFGLPIGMQQLAPLAPPVFGGSKAKTKPFGENLGSFAPTSGPPEETPALGGFGGDVLGGGGQKNIKNAMQDLFKRKK